MKASIFSARYPSTHFDSVVNDKKEWISLLRVIATIAVVILHVASPILNQYNDIMISYWHVGNVYDSMVRFSVPLFFMVSGVLLLNKDYELLVFLKKG